MINPRTALGILLFFTGLASPVFAGKIREGVFQGYLIAQNNRLDEKYGAGFSLYAAAYSLVEQYPGHRFQTGLFSTWMHPNIPDQPFKLYTDIEGGLGWWRGTRFPSSTPKFSMGGIGPNFDTVASGPGNGKGTWEKPLGFYGVAQLSPWILFPLDCLNLKQGSCGELLGYGYLSLPLTTEKKKTRDKPLATGNQSWTLFLNAQNFKGPVAFFTPYFWSEAKLTHPEYEGLLLDQVPAQPQRATQMETQYIPCALSQDQAGETYAKIAAVRFPYGAGGESVLIRDILSYGKNALWDGVKAWFEGGPPARGEIEYRMGANQLVYPGEGYATWTISEIGAPQETRSKVDIKSFLKLKSLDPDAFGAEWDYRLATKTMTKDGFMVQLPEYYHLKKGAKESIWTAISVTDVPPETGLKDYNFRTPLEPKQPALTTPSKGCWKNPGPAAGPFYATLGDGSIVTYYWYRFADQPAILNADLSDQERKELQRRVELLHRNWTKEKNYLPPPLKGRLAEIDPALLVTPPKGLEIGFVPICTHQWHP